MPEGLAGILNALQSEAERQLQAARRIDVAALDESTQRRQDLLFELRLAAQENPEAAQGEEIRAAIESIRRIDDRLARVVQSVLALIAQDQPPETPETYGAHGRLNG